MDRNIDPDDVMDVSAWPWERDGTETVIIVTHDVQEAVFLCDRVIPMTSRPGRLKEEIVVDLPRPRSLDLLTTPQFVALAAKLRQSLG